MLSMRLLLIRHGQTTSNVMHALDTSAPGADLTELGRTQAAVIPEVLSDERIDGLYVSNLVRTQQTAQPLADARALTPITRLGIREISAGALEMRSDDEALKEYIEVVFGWPSEPDLRVGGAENAHEVLARFDAVVAEAAAAGLRDVAMVSHGAVIRAYAAARATNVAPDYAAHHWLHNTGMVVLEGSRVAGWEMTRWIEDPLGGRELSGEPIEDPTGAPEELTVDGS